MARRGSAGRCPTGYATPRGTSREPGLFARHRRRICAAMRAILIPALALPFVLSVSAAALAATHHATAKPAASSKPRELGKFGDWTAAVYEQSGKKVCYAFTRAESSKPALPDRGPAILTVTERPGAAESIALEAGFTYPPKATVTVQVDPKKLEFYTAGHNAFARDSKAAEAAFERGAKAVAHAPAPHGKQEVVDTFSLKGFSDAHDAILKACPAK